METKIDQSLLEKTLLGGSFTFNGICAFWCGHHDADVRLKRERQIDRTIQKLRRKGRLAYFRQGNTIVWTPIRSDAEAPDRASAGGVRGEVPRPRGGPSERPEDTIS